MKVDEPRVASSIPTSRVTLDPAEKNVLLQVGEVAHGTDAFIQALRTGPVTRSLLDSYGSFVGSFPEDLHPVLERLAKGSFRTADLPLIEKLLARLERLAAVRETLNQNLNVSAAFESAVMAPCDKLVHLLQHQHELILEQREEQKRCQPMRPFDPSTAEVANSIDRYQEEDIVVINVLNHPTEAIVRRVTHDRLYASIDDSGGGREIYEVTPAMLRRLNPLRIGDLFQNVDGFGEVRIVGLAPGGSSLEALHTRSDGSTGVLRNWQLDAVVDWVESRLNDGKGPSPQPPFESEARLRIPKLSAMPVRRPSPGLVIRISRGEEVQKPRLFSGFGFEGAAYSNRGSGYEYDEDGLIAGQLPLRSKVQGEVPFALVADELGAEAHLQDIHGAASGLVLTSMFSAVRHIAKGGDPLPTLSWGMRKADWDLVAANAKEPSYNRAVSQSTLTAAVFLDFTPHVVGSGDSPFVHFLPDGRVGRLWMPDNYSEWLYQATGEPSAGLRLHHLVTGSLGKGRASPRPEVWKRATSGSWYWIPSDGYETELRADMADLEAGRRITRRHWERTLETVGAKLADPTLSFEQKAQWLAAYPHEQVKAGKGKADNFTFVLIHFTDVPASTSTD